MENKTAEVKPLEFLMARLDGVAPERYPTRTVRMICATAMEDYASLQCAEMKKERDELKLALRETIQVLEDQAWLNEITWNKLDEYKSLCNDTINKP